MNPNGQLNLSSEAGDGEVHAGRAIIAETLLAKPALCKSRSSIIDVLTCSWISYNDQFRTYGWPEISC